MPIRKQNYTIKKVHKKFIRFSLDIFVTYRYRESCESEVLHL